MLEKLLSLIVNNWTSANVDLTWLSKFEAVEETSSDKSFCLFTVKTR